MDKRQTTEVQTLHEGLALDATGHSFIIHTETKFLLYFLFALSISLVLRKKKTMSKTLCPLDKLSLPKYPLESVGPVSY